MRSVDGVHAINITAGIALLNSGTVTRVRKMLDSLWDVTDDPTQCAHFTVQLPNGMWSCRAMKDFDAVAIH
jgi:hypothetical protein